MLRFSFQNKNQKFDRIFEAFFFKSVLIDLQTNSSLSEDLQLPTYNGECLSIKEKLNNREFLAIKNFVETYKGKFQTQSQYRQILQSHFDLTDCTLSM